MTQNANGQQQAENLPAISGPRLPYHPAVEERFGVDKASWKALVEAIFPGAQSVDSIIMVLSYCKARNLDPFKRNVHIVPIWDSDKRCLVDTVWPGIGELRTTAFRTRAFAGRDETNFGPDTTRTWEYSGKSGPAKQIEVTFPEWAQVSVYRMVEGQRVAFAGPRVYWLETYSQMGRSDAPNSMWQKRPRGQLDKCAEAAALRAAFPEELGDQHSVEESGMISRLPQVEESKPGLPADGRTGFGFANRKQVEAAQPQPDHVDHDTGEVTDAESDPEPEAADTPQEPEPHEGEAPTDNPPTDPEPWERLVMELAEKSGCSDPDALQALTDHLGMHPQKLGQKSIKDVEKKVRSGEIAV